MDSGMGIYFFIEMLERWLW